MLGGHGMSALGPARPMYLDVGSEGVFAFFNPTHAGSGETAVVICPPFGWDLMSPYRARRDWAEHLAARGYPTMRIDLQGTGDSAGMPTDPARLDAWTRAVFAAALSLRCASGAQRIVAIGIGLGGVVAYHAAAAGAAVEDLVLWASPLAAARSCAAARTRAPVELERRQIRQWRHRAAAPRRGACGRLSIERRNHCRARTARSRRAGAARRRHSSHAPARPRPSARR